MGDKSIEARQKVESGYCAICGCNSTFRFDPTIITPQLKKAWGISDKLVEAFNRKESMFCDNCGSSLRIRRLAAVVIQTFSEINGRSYESFVKLLADKEFRRLKIAEINACGTLHTYLKEHPNLYYSEWMSNVNPGEILEGIRCEDLQCLTYPDDYFDIILTSETLEHVPEPDKSWREIYRTLKSKGYHIFTVPIIPWQRDTIQRTQLVSGSREHLSEPAYHGDWGRQDVFVYTDFGMDIVEKLNKIGLNTEVFYMSPHADLDVAVVFRSQKTRGPGAVAAKGASPLLEWTGERYVPWLEEAAIGYEHLHRYAFATQFVQNKKVLDLACGEGYGSHLLARTAASVVGIDIDESSVKHARNKYIKHNLEFKVGSITEVPIAGAHLFDVAVCFEALEHIDDHHKLLSEAKRLLTADGVFVVSTPNKRVYSDEPQSNNPFHIHELYFDDFKELIEKYFKKVTILGQRIDCNSNIWPVFARGDTKFVEYVIERNPKEFVFVENDKRIPLYFIAIASDSRQNIEETASALIDVSDQLLNQKDGQIAAQAKEQERLGKEVDRLHLTVESQQQVLVQKGAEISQLVAEGHRLAQTLESQQQVLVQKGAEISQLVAEGHRLAQTTFQLQGAIESQQQLLGEKEQQVAHLGAEREGLTQEVAQLQSSLLSQRETLAHREKEVTQLAREASQLEVNLRTREEYVRAIEDSLAWILLVKYRGLRDKLCPDGTRRRRIYNSVKNSCKRLTQGRVPAPQPGPQPNNTDSFRSAKNRQSISLPDSLQEWAPQTSAARSILPRPEQLIMGKSSVVIPTKNGMSEGFESTLRAISRQIGIAETEVIVVDSGSLDGTVEAAKSYGAKVFSIPPAEFNHGATRNYAADQTTGDLLVFTVQDAIPATEDLFYEMAKALLADPKLAGVSVRQLPRSDADVYACWERWNHNRFHLEAPIEELGSSQEILGLPSEQLLRLAGLDNVCSMVKRSIWEKIRFRPTEYAEDLEFGLSCLRESYRIAWLPHRSVIHSHTRHPFYYMSRHYLDRRVMQELLKDRPPEWVEAVTADQLFSAVKATYLAINEFVRSIETSSMHDPRPVLRELVSYVSARHALTSAIDDRRGESSLSEFFAALGSCFRSDLSHINPCIQNYEGTVLSLLEFIGDRYPRLSGLELISIIYKAYAGVAGSVFGSFSFGGSQGKFSSSQMKRLDGFLAEGSRK